MRVNTGIPNCFLFNEIPWISVFFDVIPVKNNNNTGMNDIGENPTNRSGRESAIQTHMEKKHRFASNSCSVKKVGLSENRLSLYEQNSTMKRFLIQKYIVRHDNIVLSFVPSTAVRISLTNKNKVLLWRTLHFCALEPLHWRFLFLQCPGFIANPEPNDRWNFNC